MFKTARVDSLSSLQEAQGILKRIYEEQPKYWPYGLSSENFDAGLYLIREKQANQPVGFCGFQIRNDYEPTHFIPGGGQAMRLVKTGYYSIGILPAYRQNGFAKAAVAQLIRAKSATVDRVKALIVAGNQPSLGLARSLGVPALVKSASLASREDSLYVALCRIGNP